MKDKKQTKYVEEILERRWLHHAKHESQIFEADKIKEAMKEGWKFWPWELEENKEKREYKKKDKKEEVIPEENIDSTVNCITENLEDISDDNLNNETIENL